MSPEFWHEPQASENYESAKEQFFAMLRARQPTSERGIIYMLDDLIRQSVDMDVPVGVRPIRLAHSLAEDCEFNNIGDPDGAREHKHRILGGLSMMMLLHERVRLPDDQRMQFIEDAMGWSEDAEAAALAQDAYLSARARRRLVKGVIQNTYIDPMRKGLAHLAETAAISIGYARSQKAQANYLALNMTAAVQRDHAKRAINLAMDLKIINARHEVPLRLAYCLAKLRRPLVYTLQDQ